MATAKQEGGLYYDAVRKIMVDAEAKEVKGAAKPGPDTSPDQQPGASGAPSADPIMRLAEILKPGSTTAAATATASAAATSVDEVTLADLPDHISKMSADEVKALQKKDDRKGAVPIYEARLEEIGK